MFQSPARAVAACAIVIGASLMIAPFAVAADDPPPVDASAGGGQDQKPEAPPISLHSGVPSLEFEADRTKVSLEHRPDGTRLYHMNGQGMQAVEAHLGADGKVEFTCSDRSDGASQSAASDAANSREQ